MAIDVLIVDDEADIRELIAAILEDEGYSTRLAAHGDQAVVELAGRRPSLVILDIWLQGSRLDGLEVLDHIKREHPDVPVLMISGHGNIETAVAAIKRGAYDYLEKPFKTDRLLLLAQRAFEAARLQRENQELMARAGGEIELIGNSTLLTLVRANVERVAPTGSRVLVSGPPGSGKEVVARLLHRRSRRHQGPFVVLNAATMAPERVESELFGVEPDAAGHGRKVGVFEQAHGGTLFLDEVADMPLETQGKILRVLVDQGFNRLGGSRRIEVDVRVISSTARDLRELIQHGCFREDLYHRLNVVPVRVPALSDRRDDVPMLVEHLMRRSALALGLAPRTLALDALAVLQAHDWPGNVRELRNVVERLLIMAPGEPGAPITAAALPAGILLPAPISPKGERGEEIMTLPLREARELFERQYLLTQIGRFGGNVSRTAEFVGMERSALHRKLKMLGVPSRSGERQG
ncbi:MAG: sigma-54-dependent Fis family transcriptional regulator [Alphaproteobacteria bacterium]|nr:sigma-54-dependent Fis family transcriptional regulator [Alphaproteobacteria bacterium]